MAVWRWSLGLAGCGLALFLGRGALGCHGTEGREGLACGAERDGGLRPREVAADAGPARLQGVPAPGAPDRDARLLPEPTDSAFGALAAARITGRVLGPRGEAVAYAPLLVQGPGRESRLFAGADGRFTVPCEGPGAPDLTALDPAGLLREATALGVHPGTTELELRLRPAPELEVRVHGPQGVLLERFALAVISAASRQALAFFAEREHPEGRLVLGAPAQAFFLEVRASGFEPLRLGPFTGAAPPARVVCTLEPVGRGPPER